MAALQSAGCLAPGVLGCQAPSLLRLLGCCPAGFAVSPDRWQPAYLVVAAQPPSTVSSAALASCLAGQGAEELVSEVTCQPARRDSRPRKTDILSPVSQWGPGMGNVSVPSKTFSNINPGTEEEVVLFSHPITG